MCLATTAIAALVAGVAFASVPFPAALAVAALVPAAVIDVEQRRLPDAWVGGGLVALAIGLAAGSSIGQHVDLLGAAGGALAMGLPVLALHLMSPAAMGFGDVKAAVVLGAAVGTVDWRLGVVALCVAALSGAALGVVTRRRTIAFGPCLVFGAWLVLLAHEPIATHLFNGAPTP